MTEILNNIVKETGISKIITSYKEQFEEYEHELRNEYNKSCYGMRKQKSIILTMAGGGSHWWDYEIVFLDDEDYEVYVISKDGRGKVEEVRIFYDDTGDDTLYDISVFDEEKIEYFEESDDYYEINYYHYFE